MVEPAASISQEDEQLLVHVLAEEIQKKTLLKSAEGRKVGSKHEGRKLKRQSTEQVVDKSLKDNFRGWNSIDIDGTVVDWADPSRDHPQRQAQVQTVE